MKKMERKRLDKKKLTIISYIYTFFVVGAFALYGYLRNWSVDVREEPFPILVFIVLMFIGAILAGIDFIGEKEKRRKVDKKTVIGGITIALIFIVWRTLTELP